MLKNFPVLADKQIHIWRLSVKSVVGLAACFLLLNTEERERAVKFKVEPAKNNFIIARAYLRQLLANYLQVAPQEICFEQNQYGKLFLAGPINNRLLQFNLSHVDGLVVFAFAADACVGVDVELLRSEFDITGIAQRFFTPQEYAAITAVAEKQRILSFFNCWTCKEAVVKAIGRGVTYGLDKFAVEITTRKVGRVAVDFLEEKAITENWSLELFDPGVGCVGAFATNASDYQTCFYEVDPSVL